MPTVPGLTALTGVNVAAADLLVIDDASAGPLLKSIRADLLLQGLLVAASAALLDANSNEFLKLGTTSSAVNEVTVTNAATGTGPLVAATGGDTNIPISVDGKGSGAVNLNITGTGAVKVGTQLQLPTSGIIQDANANELVKFPASVASAINEITVSNAATGNGPLVAATGGDTNIPLSIDGKGSGVVNLNVTGTGAVKVGTQLQMKTAGIIQDASANELIKFPATVASAINEITVSNAAASSGPLIAATGGDTNIPLSLDGKGSGVLNLNVTGTGAVKVGTVVQLPTSSAIWDAGGNELIKFPSTVASAINEVTVSNAAASSGPSVAATGGDTDIDLNLTAKGTGTLKTAFGLVSSSATKGLGYAAGAGGTVTQATNRSTGVTLSKPTGAITTDTTSLAAAASATFTVTNTLVAINDVVNVSIRSGQTNKETTAVVSAVAAGSFDITVHNKHASTAEVGAIVVNYTLHKGAVA